MNIEEKIKETKKRLDEKLSELNTNKCTVSIFETSDFYGADEYDEIVQDWNDEEELSKLRIKYNDKYIGLPMYEAYIQDSNDDTIDDTTTGRYCDIDSVIDEIEGTVFLLTNGTSELTILGHDIIIQIDMDSLVDTTQDDIVMRINQSILDGNDGGSIELNQVFYDWEIESSIEYKTIGLKYNDGDTNVIDYLNVNINASQDLIQKCINVALRTREDEISNLKRMLEKKKIDFKNFECELYDF